jgi:glycosyltransferase involved in cell wall biosynthesis
VKTAIVHDWLYSLAGAEKVVEAIYSLYPSPIYTLILNRSNMQESLLPMEQITTSFIQKFPKASTKYPWYLPLFPLAIESLDVSHADVVLSSSSCVAKNILSSSNQLHICYCHTPMRYIWDMQVDYLKDHHLDKGIKSFLTKLLFHYLRTWDLTHAQRVDHYIANSQTVAKRIFKTYRRHAEVIYPPVNVDFFSKTQEKKEEFYLTASRLVPYKKIDLIIKTFSKFPNKKLIVLGEGPELNTLKKIATQNVEFLGKVSNTLLRSYMKKAKAFIYMALEDFGILPVEAQAAGLPVIAFNKGGCQETILPGKTGMLIHSQSEASLYDGILAFEKIEDSFDPNFLKCHAEKFSHQNFLSSYKKTVDGYIGEFISS